MTLDAEHPDAPSEKGAVKARSVINANVFLKAEGGVKWLVVFGMKVLTWTGLIIVNRLSSARVVQIDPAGSIPSFVVNAKASDFMTDVEKMRKFPG